MKKKDEMYCNEYREKIEQHFRFLINDHDYSIVFLKRLGRYQSDCVFGLECPGKPKFQLGGETGPYIAVAAPTVNYSTEHEGSADYPWLFIHRIDDFMAGRDVNMEVDGFPDWDEKFAVLAEITKRLLPKILDIFSSEDSVASWRQEYDLWFDRGYQEHIKKISK